MSQSMRAEASAFPASPASPRSAAHRCSKRARLLKLELSQRLVRTRNAVGLVQRDVHDRPQLVREWEDPHKPHAPNVLHIIEQGLDPVSRVYALEALEFAREKIERAAQENPAQLSLLDLLASSA